MPSLGHVTVCAKGVQHADNKVEGIRGLNWAGREAQGPSAEQGRIQAHGMQQANEGAGSQGKDHRRLMADRARGESTCAA